MQGRRHRSPKKTQTKAERNTAEAGGEHKPAPVERDGRGRFVPGNPNRWLPGKSGNPGGRPRGASFAAALARQALTPVSTREEMARIAATIGLDPQEAHTIDVVATLFYVVLCRSLFQAAKLQGRADERLVGLLQVLLKALDPNELRVSGPDGGPIPIAGVIANVRAALGMQSHPEAPFVDGNEATASSLAEAG